MVFISRLTTIYYLDVSEPQRDSACKLLRDSDLHRLAQPTTRTKPLDGIRVYSPRAFPNAGFPVSNSLR